MKLFQMFALGSVMATGLVMAQVPSTPSAPSKTSTAKTAAKEVKAKMTPPTAAEIADAKSKNLVWVNLNSKKFHRPEAQQYGTTKNGKFMTEADAKAAGNVEAKDQVAKAKKTPKP
jgi:hypothetical protein